jgi:hypothetical protein
MYKKILTAALAVAMMALVACGGSDKKSDSTAASSSNKALSYSDFGKQADALCASISAETDPVGEKLTGQADGDAPVWKKVIPILKAANPKFKQLKPPTELQAAFDEFNSVNDQQLAKFAEAQTLAEAQDQAGYETVLQELRALSTQSDAAGSALGAPACANTA